MCCITGLLGPDEVPAPNSSGKAVAQEVQDAAPDRPAKAAPHPKPASAEEARKVLLSPPRLI